jgi:uncharacterized phage protein (TIGR02220 family)
MSRYRKVDPRFWKDEKVIAFSPEEKLVALYLFTGQSNRIGLFSFSPGEAAEDVGTLPQTFGERFGKVCQTLGLGWDETFRVLYIPTWWKYNQPENVNNVLGNLKDLEDVPDCPLFDKFAKNLEFLSANFHETFTQTVAKRYPKRYPKRSGTQEQEQEQEYKSGAKAPDSSSSISERKKLTRRRGAIPPELQPAVSVVIAKINELAGTHYHDDKPGALKTLIARLQAGASESECLAVVEHQWRKWGDNDDMREHFNPGTLFHEENFEKYLANAQRGNRNGYAEAPKILKRDGDVLTLQNGTITPVGTYERKYGIAV